MSDNLHFPFDQVAIGVTSDRLFQEACLEFNRSIGAQFIAEDEVLTVGRNVHGHRIENRARLAFAYNVWKGGLEHEVLQYLEGWSWHKLISGAHAGEPFLSHFGRHCETLGEMEVLSRGRMALQEVVTVMHSNPAIMDTRRYHYKILDTRRQLGAELKLIRRLTLEEAAQLREQLMR